VKLVNLLNSSDYRFSACFVILIVEHLKVIYIENNKDLVIYVYVYAGLFVKLREADSLESISLVLVL
jgi:hypothetical protein